MMYSPQKFEIPNQYDQNASHILNEIPVEIAPEESSENPESPEFTSGVDQLQGEDSLNSQARNEERAVEIATSISQTESKLGEVRGKLGLLHDAETSQNIPSIEHARKIQYGLQSPLIKEQRDMIEGKQSEVEIQENDIPQGDYLDSDPRLKDVENELISDWEKIYGSRYDKQGIQKTEFQDFMYGTQQNPKSLDQRAQESFAARFPNASKEYVSREKTRVYEKPSDDPAVKKFEKDMTFSTNENLKGLSDRAYIENRAGISKAQEMQSIRAFISQYPEKATAYGQMPGFEFFIDFMASEERNKKRNVILERGERVREKEGEILVSKEEMKNELLKDISKVEENQLTDEEREIALQQSPIIDHSAFFDVENSSASEPSFEWVDLKTVVGRPMIDGVKNPSWSYEYSNRQGRIKEIASEVSKIGSDENEMEHIFHYGTPSERIKVLKIDGPQGPLYSVKDGTHRVAGLKFSGLPKMPAEVFRVKYPVVHETYDEDVIYEWQKLIDRGLVQGSIKKTEDISGKKKYSVKIEKEVLSWIRSSQNNLIKISILYDKMYPGALDNLSIPKEALLDPVANNYFMAGRWQEWLNLAK